MSHILDEKRPLHARTTPIAFPDDTIVFAIGDVHGQYNAFREAINLCARIRPAGKKRVLVLTGDLLDRGPASLLCLHAGAELVQKSPFDEVIYLPGNHEQLLLLTLAALRRGDTKDRMATAWVRNGGMAMLEEISTRWHKMPTPALLEAILTRLPTINGLPFEQAMRAAPKYARFGDVLFVHAGLDPATPMDQHFATPLESLDNKWAWIREDFLLHEGGHYDTDGRELAVVHGHTVSPTAHLDWTTTPDAMRRGMDCLQHQGRICIDGGAANAAHVAGAVFCDGHYRIFAVPCA